MAHPRRGIAAGLLLMALPLPALAQHEVIPRDSAQVEIRTVLRAFYLHLESRNWEALSPYVLSPKLLERRGGPEDVHVVTRDRERGSGSSHAAAPPKSCPVTPPALIEEATMRLDGDWAEISVPRCSGAAGGVDELRMLYFEERWRFIYTDLFDGSPTQE